MKKQPALMCVECEDYAGTRLANAIGDARHAQKDWAQLAVRERLRVIRKFRGLMADHLPEMVSAVAASRRVPDAEILVSEILPLLDAAKYLEGVAGNVLRPRRMGSRLRPIWLGSVDLEVRREPFGVVLVIGPANYPLFLAGVQTLQALVAGNAVLLKPGRHASPALYAFQALLVQAGLNAKLMTLLSEDEEEARRCIATGVDKIVLTGSSNTGQAVLEQAAQSLTPVAAELSGADAVFVLASANIPLAARAIVFGLSLNHSRTCMRPHRVFVDESVREAFTYELRKQMAEIDLVVDTATARRATRLVADAVRGGARVVNQIKPNAGLPEAVQFPLLIEDVPVFTEITSADIFAPVLVLEGFVQVGQAIESYERCPYALGVSIFCRAKQSGESSGREWSEAQDLARKINAGFVVINDVIVPTADPRLPFSGRDRSGFGVTRGAEGLLELTRIKAISTRVAGYKHLEPTLPGDGAFFAAFIRSIHGGTWQARWAAIKNLMSAGRHRRRHQTGAKISKEGFGLQKSESKGREQ